MSLNSVLELLEGTKRFFVGLQGKKSDDSMEAIKTNDAGALKVDGTMQLSGSNVKKAFVITPDDVNDLAVNALSLSCTEEGLVYVDFVEGGENVPIKLVPGLWNPANVKKVHATNTTALGIIGQEA